MAMRLFRVLLTLLFAISFLGGPVTGALAAENAESTWAMHAQKAPDGAPAKAPLHQCKTCIGCAPAPAPAAGPGPMAAAVTLASIEWTAPVELHTGRTTAPEPAPPRTSF